MFLIFLVYILFASTFTIAKLALAYISPLLFIGCRMTFAGALLLLYYNKKKARDCSIGLQHVWLFLQIVIFHIFLAYTLEFIALTKVSSATVCLSYNLSPFFTALFSYILYGETLSKRQLIGLAIGFSAFIPLLWSELIQISSLSIHNFTLLAAVASSSYGWIVMRKLMHYGYSSLFINGVGMLGGGLLALAASLGSEHGPAITAPIISSMVYATVYGLLLIIIANIICYNLYSYLLMRYSPTFLSFMGLLTPLFAALFGMAFLHETINREFFLAIGMVLWGLVLFATDKGSD